MPRRVHRKTPARRRSDGPATLCVRDTAESPQRSPDWCGLLERADSPWYPTMRLFRQRRSGEWDLVFEAILAAVAERLGERNVAP